MSTPTTTVQEIRERQTMRRRSPELQPYVDDIDFLLAEVDRLKAENERLLNEFVPLS